MKAKILVHFKTTLLELVLVMFIGCKTNQTSNHEADKDVSRFSYDQAAFPGA